jgi:hypothetical protein
MLKFSKPSHLLKPLHADFLPKHFGPESVKPDSGFFMEAWLSNFPIICEAIFFFC